MEQSGLFVERLQAREIALYILFKYLKSKCKSCLALYRVHTWIFLFERRPFMHFSFLYTCREIKSSLGVLRLFYITTTGISFTAISTLSGTILLFQWRQHFKQTMSLKRLDISIHQAKACSSSLFERRAVPSGHGKLEEKKVSGNTSQPIKCIWQFFSGFCKSQNNTP